MTKRSNAIEKIVYKLSDVFTKFEIKDINLSTSAAGIVLTYTNYDSEAAWQMYVELLTRITTQKLEMDSGVEETALESIRKMFDITRDILKQYGHKAKSFTKISVIILNQKIRPFTAKWHKLKIENAFADDKKCKEFRQELELLRIILVKYTRILAEMAKVDDLTFIIED